MANKPFFLVPAVQACPAPVLMGGCSGKLQITITAKTPMHFGAGQLLYDEKASLFVNRLCRENDQITLPGSSFKGMLRSVFEAVSESCMPTDRNTRCAQTQSMCPACSVFGLLGRKGRLQFSSFVLEEGGTENLSLPQLFSHPTNVNQRRFYRHSTAYSKVSRASEGKGGSELYECLSPNAVLRGHITYQNLTEDQLGGLLFALGLGWGAPIYHKLGYAKPVYLGSVQLDIEQEELEKTLLSATQQTHDLAALAQAYYDKHTSNISDVAARLKEACSSIGDENGWDMQTLTY
jgi:CRISPR/Cas system CSM-associated protein Csm3 (group 7 of RAMP superfamily)